MTSAQLQAIRVEPDTVNGIPVLTLINHRMSAIDALDPKPQRAHTVLIVGFPEGQYLTRQGIHIFQFGRPRAAVTTPTR